jgi:hypothetical protein
MSRSWSSRVAPQAEREGSARGEPQSERSDSGFGVGCLTADLFKVAVSDDSCVCNRRISRMARISRHRRRCRHLYLPSSARRSSTSSSSSVVISLQHRAGRWRYDDEKGANRQPKKAGPSLRRSTGAMCAACPAGSCLRLGRRMRPRLPLAPPPDAPLINIPPEWCGENLPDD